MRTTASNSNDSALRRSKARHWRSGRSLELKTPVYLSVDIDALDPAYAPGVAHREPGGLTTRDALGVIQSIDQPIVAEDVVECNPRCDISNLTAIVAAKLVKEIAAVMLVENLTVR
jgi:arginase family enzyme